MVAANLRSMEEGSVAGVGKGLALGLAVGVVVGLAAGAAFEVGEPLGWWGAVDGGLAGIVVFLIVLARGRRAGMRVVARWLLVAVLAIVAFAVAWWNVAWGVQPWTLEGMWLWPLATVVLGGLVLAVRAALSAEGSDGG